MHPGTFKRCNVGRIIVLRIHITKHTREALEIAIQLNSWDQSNQIFVNVSVYGIAVTRVSAAIEDKYLILTDNDFYDSENYVYCVLLFDFDPHMRKSETCVSRNFKCITIIFIALWFHGFYSIIKLRFRYKNLIFHANGINWTRERNLSPKNFFI